MLFTANADELLTMLSLSLLLLSSRRPQKTTAKVSCVILGWLSVGGFLFLFISMSVRLTFAMTDLTPIVSPEFQKTLELKTFSPSAFHIGTTNLINGAQTLPQLTSTGVDQSSMLDLSGKWEILEVEDNKHYTATLDKTGNGSYTQHSGRFITTHYANRLWLGTWHQLGNDREGGFELLLSDDKTQATGRWWYLRVGSQKNIPPRDHGGSYEWKRLTPVP